MRAEDERRGGSRDEGTGRSHYRQSNEGGNSGSADEAVARAGQRLASGNDGRRSLIVVGWSDKTGKEEAGRQQEGGEAADRQDGEKIRS